MFYISKHNPKNSPFNAINRILAFLLIVLFTSCSGDYSNLLKAQEFERAKDFKKMNFSDKKEVSPGVWGGTGIILTVEQEGVKIQYDCAEAVIDEKLMIDKQGNFSVEGLYKRDSFGAVRIGFEPKNQPALFKGRIRDKQMTLEVILTENEEKIGDYTLERDKKTRLRRCL